MRNKSILVLAMICMMTFVSFASADTIRGIDIDFVTIGNVGNAGDTRVEANPYGCGAVGYDYHIGKYEITNAQWNAFIAVAGAPRGNPYYAYDDGAYFTGAQQPANCVSWYESLQFCNYLTSGDKSKGVYQFSGNNTNAGNFLGINRAGAQATYGTIYFLPTQDEWYKAAYYKPDGSGYSLYANGTNTAPIAGVQSNYNYAISAPWNINTGTVEQNGTFDMMGNVSELTETITSSYPRVRGGEYDESYGLSSSESLIHYPYTEYINLGFRVASIPEPATLFLLGMGGLALLRKRRV